MNMIGSDSVPTKKLKLTKGFSMTWFDLSSLSDDELDERAKNPPPIDAEPKEHDLWFEVQMERQRRKL